jgi:hypothetical protein
MRIFGRKPTPDSVIDRYAEIYAPPAWLAWVGLALLCLSVVGFGAFVAWVFTV